MIDTICNELNNWFDVKRIHGHFDIVDGSLQMDEIAPNQYFRIVGSVFNDGVYRNDSSLLLSNESFDGSIWVMAVPPSAVTLFAKIEEWQKKNEKLVKSPYQSESFGGYSYSLKTGESGGVSWKNVFAKELNQYRKARFCYKEDGIRNGAYK